MHDFCSLKETAILSDSDTALHNNLHLNTKCLEGHNNGLRSLLNPPMAQYGY